jgi:heterodisulfide reductase subunit C
VLVNSTQPTVLYEKSLNLDLLREISHVPGIERVKRCIQCGTCTGSCPVSWAMEDTPRKVLGLIRAGMRERVVDSMAIWTCASCYYCAARCPQNIPITEVMYALKRRAIRENREKSRNAQALSREFVKVVRKYGRNHETSLMARFLMRTRPFTAYREIPIGLTLMRQGRLPLAARPIRDIESLRRIMAKAEELGGTE